MVAVPHLPQSGPARGTIITSSAFVAGVLVGYLLSIPSQSPFELAAAPIYSQPSQKYSSPAANDTVPERSTPRPAAKTRANRPNAGTAKVVPIEKIIEDAAAELRDALENSK